VSTQSNQYAPLSQDQYIVAYQEVAAKFGFSRTIEPGRIHLLGWDLEYVCGPALPSFIDSILVRRLNDFVPDNDCPLIIDCGANIGFSVLNYKRQFPNARIVAFEPDPVFLPALRLNLERNGAADVQVVDAAVWVQDGSAQWLCEGIDGSKIIAADEPTGQNIVSVRTIDFAGYITSEIDLVKLDIEGAEYQVVIHLADKGKLALLKNMIIECHLDQSNIGLLAKMMESLVGAGFQIGINSIGQWRDLIRQTVVSPNHYEQYLAVAAWRKPVAPNETDEKPYLPYVGIDQLMQETRLQQIQSELQNTQSQLQNTQSELRNTQNEVQATRNELQTTWSELQATQNEVQDTRNELQTTWSELQATQSELYSYTRLGKPFHGAVRLINLLLDLRRKGA
jgi:FkbM family methyltransferase